MRFPASRTVFGLAVVLTVSAGLGGVFGQERARTSPQDDIGPSLERFTSLLGLIEDNYATPVESDKAVYGAIDGMLRTLDPHSHFSDPKAYAAAIEDQTGRYFGLGISVSVRFGKATVVSPPSKNSPAEKADLRVGDIISTINGEPTDNLPLNTIVSKLKGPRGSSVRISVVRTGVAEPFEISVTRDEIEKFTISNAFLIKPGIGYVKLDSFAETSADELQEALKKLDSKNLDGLIFDLRANPGGVLTSAIEIAETFLQKGQLILETRGRAAGSSIRYIARKVNSENRYPLVLLINQSSASASEIVAGALQDHDRALIVGETSFGKGLVQSVIPLSGKAGLALTTQKWYTPSGRLIQRDYSNISLFDYYNHLGRADKKKDDIRHSDSGRLVYGGGGITPDYDVPTLKPTEFELSMLDRFAFFTFARDFLASNPVVDANFQVSDGVIEEFKQHLQKRKIDFGEADFRDNLTFLERMIRFEVIFDKFGTAEAAKTLLYDDPQVLRAIELLPEARTLADKLLQKRSGANF